jgi:hypothetical protein
MFTQTEYFILMAVLFAGYLFMRVFVVWSFRLPKPPPEQGDHSCNGIDAGELSSRVQHVREKLLEPKPASQTNSFKRELLVQGKREQVAKLAFFQSPPPPPPEPQEPEQGFHLLMA